MFWKIMTPYYTQVIWAETYLVGCGLVRQVMKMSLTMLTLQGDDGWYKTIINCIYAEGGNMREGFVCKLGEGCSNCPVGTACDSNFDYLCA